MSSGFSDASLNALLPQVLRPLHFKISLPIHLMQLTGVALGRCEPVLQTVFKLRRRSYTYRCQKRINREVIPHRIALHQSTHTAYIVGLAIRLTAIHCKPDLAAAYSS